LLAGLTYRGTLLTTFDAVSARGFGRGRGVLQTDSAGTTACINLAFEAVASPAASCVR